MSQTSQMSQLLQQILISQTTGISIHKQYLAQVPQMSQLPRQPLIPQTIRILAHTQHLSQLSQIPHQRRPPSQPEEALDASLYTLSREKGVAHASLSTSRCITIPALLRDPHLRTSPFCDNNRRSRCHHHRHSFRYGCDLSSRGSFWACCHP